MGASRTRSLNPVTGDSVTDESAEHPRYRFYKTAWKHSHAVNHEFLKTRLLLFVPISLNSPRFARRTQAESIMLSFPFPAQTSWYGFFFFFRQHFSRPLSIPDVRGSSFDSF